MKQGSVPTHLVGPLISELIRDRWPQGGGIEVLAEKVGCDYSAIESIIAHTNPGAGFDFVDRIFCALGRPDIWRGKLISIYEDLIFVQTCAVPSCDKTFPEKKSGHVKRYCSARCATLAHGIRDGRCTGDRLRQKGYCLKGHKLTPENTRIEKRKDGRSGRICKTCQRDYQRQWARKRRATDPRFVARKQSAHRKWKQTAAVAA